MDMLWDAPEPQHFAEEMQQLSDLSPLLLETIENTIPVFHDLSLKTLFQHFLSLKTLFQYFTNLV